MRKPISRNKARISLRVSPSSTKNELLGFAEGVLRIKIAAPPVKGEANDELISFLSRLLGIPKGALNIIKGHASKNKVITIEGLSQEELMKRLSSFFAGADTSRLPHQ